MSEFNNIMKLWLNSLAIFDNCYFNISIIIILVLYSSVIFENINVYVSELYNYSIIRLVVLLLIIYIAPKSPTISILLGISYIISIHYMSNSLLSNSHKFEKFKGNSQEMEYKENDSQEYNILNDNEQAEYDAAIDGALNDISEILQSPEAKELCHDVCDILTSNESFTNMGDVNQDLDKLKKNQNQNIKDAELKAIDAASILLNSVKKSVEGNEKFQNQDMNKNSPVLSTIQGLVNQYKKENFDVKSDLTSLANDPRVKDLIKEIGVGKEKFSNKQSASNTCEKLHIPMHGQLSNSCEPVKLFSTEYNAQGLNNEIMGQNINYHPVGSDI
jgi:hypothetical protein